MGASDPPQLPVVLWVKFWRLDANSEALPGAALPALLPRQPHLPSVSLSLSMISFFSSSLLIPSITMEGFQCAWHWARCWGYSGEKKFTVPDLTGSMRWPGCSCRWPSFPASAAWLTPAQPVGPRWTSRFPSLPVHPSPLGQHPRMQVRSLLHCLPGLALAHRFVVYFLHICLSH